MCKSTGKKILMGVMIFALALCWVTAAVAGPSNSHYFDLVIDTADTDYCMFAAGNQSGVRLEDGCYGSTTYGNYAGARDEKKDGVYNMKDMTNNSAFGFNAVLQDGTNNATAIGAYSHAMTTGATSIGAGSYATVTNSTALGYNAYASYKNSVAIGANSATIGENEVSFGNADSGLTRKLTNVSAGNISHTSTDAVNASQLQDTRVNSMSLDTRTSDNHKILTVNLENGYYPAEGITDSKSIDVTQLIQDHIEIKGALGNVSTSNGIVSTKTVREEGGVKYVDIDMHMGDNFRLTDAYTGNYTDYTNNGVSINGKTYVSSAGLNANGQKITNVADGTIAPNSKDAVNGGQMYEMYRLIEQTGAVELDHFRTQLAETGKEVQEVGAMSAALAGLHYMEPTGEGDDKVTGAVSYGGYRSQNAVAVGLAYKPNQNMMFSAATSIGSNQNSYNAGVAFKFGPGKSVNRAEMAKQIKHLNEKLEQESREKADLKAENARQDAKIEEQGKENAQLRTELNELKELVSKLMKK